jgi:tetratricopeptide (TPR) repeat protein
MSEAIKSKKPQNRVQTIIIVVVISILVLLLPLFLYGSGLFVLPTVILSNHQSKNCQSVLSLKGLYSSIYPGFMQDRSLDDYVRECALYTLAVQNEEQKNWRDSYNDYAVYMKIYPAGLFSGEAHEHSAVVIGELAKEEIGQKRYSEALTNLNLILNDYSDTSTATDAERLVSDLYLAWGVELREAGDFLGSKQVLSEFITLLQNATHVENVKSAQRELALTYMMWGMKLQEQKQFDEAKAKFDLAVSTDPDSAVQIQANQEKFYSEWGDYFVGQGEFAEAMDHYGTAAGLAEKRDPAAAKDIMANAYVHWAEGLSSAEDFIGALVLLDFAEMNAATDSTKEMVVDARQDVYLAFSESSGEQAVKALKDVIVIVCEHHIQPQLPIFGLDSDSVLAGVYGINVELPENIAATTPGSLHFVACIGEDTKVVGSAVHAVGSFVFNPGAPYSLVQVKYERHQYIWTVSLRKADTGEEFAVTLIEGGEPPSLPSTTQQIYEGATNPLYFGPKPDVADLADWLLTVIR